MHRQLLNKVVKIDSAVIKELQANETPIDPSDHSCRVWRRCEGFEFEWLPQATSVGFDVVRSTYVGERPLNPDSPGRTSLYNTYRSQRLPGHNYKLTLERELLGTEFTITARIPRHVARDARIGQKVSLDLQLRVTYVSRGASNIRLDGYAVGVEHELMTLRCDNGHVYAPASGYKFCPVDGLPLKGGGAH